VPQGSSHAVQCSIGRSSHDGSREPERLSASKSAFARGFASRHVQDSANLRASPGGTPEAWDADLAATLVREAFEENQVRVGATAYLGYQEVHRPGRAPYAQVRMAVGFQYLVIVSDLGRYDWADNRHAARSYS
jgi:8-oxo-dGTP pyrophosphatase MutT (NUDIX family)